MEPETSPDQLGPANEGPDTSPAADRVAALTPEAHPEADREAGDVGAEAVTANQAGAAKPPNGRSSSRMSAYSHNEAIASSLLQKWFG